MKSFDEQRIKCPFDTRHEMPKSRLQWHLPKCKAKQDREALGLPTFVCKFNSMHIFFEQELILAHEADCESKLRLDATHDARMWRTVIVGQNDDDSEFK